MNIIEHISILFEYEIARSKSNNPKSLLTPGNVEYRNARLKSIRSGSKLTVNSDGSLIQSIQKKKTKTIKHSSGFMDRLNSIQSTNLKRWSPNEIKQHGSGKNFGSKYLNSLKGKDHNDKL